MKGYNKEEWPSYQEGEKETGNIYLPPYISMASRHGVLCELCCVVNFYFSLQDVFTFFSGIVLNYVCN